MVVRGHRQRRLANRPGNLLGGGGAVAPFVVLGQRRRCRVAARVRRGVVRERIARTRRNARLRRAVVKQTRLGRRNGRGSDDREVRRVECRGMADIVILELDGKRMDSGRQAADIDARGGKCRLVAGIATGLEIVVVGFILVPIQREGLLGAIVDFVFHPGDAVGRPAGIVVFIPKLHLAAEGDVGQHAEICSGKRPVTPCGATVGIGIIPPVAPTFTGHDRFADVDGAGTDPSGVGENRFRNRGDSKKRERFQPFFHGEQPPWDADNIFGPSPLLYPPPPSPSIQCIGLPAYHDAPLPAKCPGTSPPGVASRP